MSALQKLRLSLITLGVADLARSRAFYEALGLTPAPLSQGSVVFFQLSGIVLSLYPRPLLAEDATVAEAGTGFRAIALAANLDSSEEVDALIARAADSGGRVVKPGGTVFWGGYSGYFADPDDHLWEVAYNPFFTFDERGILELE